MELNVAPGGNVPERRFLNSEHNTEHARNTRIGIEGAVFQTLLTCSDLSSRKTKDTALGNTYVNAVPAFRFSYLAARFSGIYTAGGTEDLIIHRNN